MSNLHHGPGGPFPGSRLEDVEVPVLHRKFDVLHVLVVFFQLLKDSRQFFVRFRHGLLQGLELGLSPGLSDVFVDRSRGANAGDHVLSLGVGEVLPGVLPGAVGGVPGKGDPGGAIVPHVSKHHDLDVHGRPDVVGKVVDLPPLDGPVVVPGCEYRRDGSPQLVVRVLREGLPGVILVDLLEFLHEVLPVLGRELGVVLDPGLGLLLIDQFLVHVVFNALHHVAVHLDEPPVAVVSKPPVVGLVFQPLDRLVVEPQVEHGIHHPRHAHRGPRPNAQQEGVFGIPEPLSVHQPFQPFNVFVDRLLEAFGVFPVVLEVQVADLGGDGESGRNRDSNPAHLRQVGPLPSQQMSKIRSAFGLPVAKKEYMLCPGVRFGGG